MEGMRVRSACAASTSRPRIQHTTAARVPRHAPNTRRGALAHPRAPVAFAAVVVEDGEAWVEDSEPEPAPPARKEVVPLPKSLRATLMDPRWDPATEPLPLPPPRTRWPRRDLVRLVRELSSYEATWERVEYLVEALEGARYPASLVWIHAEVLRNLRKRRKAKRAVAYFDALAARGQPKPRLSPHVYAEAMLAASKVRTRPAHANAHARNRSMRSNQGPSAISPSGVPC